MRSIISLSLIFFLLICASCKSSKRGIQKNIHNEKEIRAGLKAHNLTYEWFTAKGKISLESENESISARIYLRVQRDHAIWMVVKKFGIEAARVLITPEDFTIVYRLEQVYEQESLQTLKESFNTNLSFQELQDYIVGNIPEINSPEFTFRQNEKEVICQTFIHDLKSYLRLNPTNLQLTNFEVYNEKNESVKGSYGAYEQIESRAIPAKRTFEVSSLEHGDMRVSINLSDIAVDKPASMKFSIPAHYEKLKYYRPF